MINMNMNMNSNSQVDQLECLNSQFSVGMNSDGWDDILAHCVGKFS